MISLVALALTFARCYATNALDTVYAFADITPAARAAIGDQPNITHSVTFAFEGSASQWSWRINITDLPTPDDGLNVIGRPELSNYTQGLHAIYSSWELLSPADAAINDTLGGHGNQTSSNLCSAHFSAAFPSNVTSKFQEKADGDCSAYFGDQCTQALTQSLLTRDCGSTIVGLMPDACKDTFNLASDDLATGTSRGFAITDDSMALSNLTYSSNGSLPLWSEALYTHGSNQSYLERVEAAVNMLAVVVSDNTTGAVSKSKLLCQVVRKSDTPKTGDASAYYSHTAMWWISTLAVVAVLALL